MNKARFRPGLRLQLMAAVLCSIGLAVLAFYGVRSLVDELIFLTVQQEEFQMRQELRAVRSLQSHINAQLLKIDDSRGLSDWVEKEKYVLLKVVRDGTVLYDSSIPYNMDGSELSPLEMTGYSYYYDEEYPLPLYPVQFADGAAQVQVICFNEWEYYNYSMALAALLSFFIFVLVFLLLIHRKLKYILLLESELRILEGGDLEYPVTLRGKDELSQLAQGVDDMRRSIIERQLREDQARTANQELITAISHDLRTPLTSLMGYLDILELHRYKENQLDYFIRHSREKAYQIKSMSDKLFEYFLVYGKETLDAELQEVDGQELLEQMVGEGLFELRSRGFAVSGGLSGGNCRLLVNPALLRRVFHNLFSNLIKYADSQRKIQVDCGIVNGCLELSFTNAPLEGRRAESTEMGLKICAKIIALHQGGFEACKSEGQFITRLWLPILP